MSRFSIALVLALSLGACSGQYRTAPQDLDNACSILQQRPAFRPAMERAERKWGVPVALQMATIYQESKFISNAKTPRKYFLGIIPNGRQSSAKGYAQAIDGTWEEYQRAENPYGSRTDIKDATDFMGWYMAGSTKRLRIPLHDVRSQYLAYHEGRGGYQRGSYKSKKWLLDVADEVESRAITYSRQLTSCS